jgi:hypothetical protein
VSSKTDKLKEMRSMGSLVSPITPRETVKSVEIGQEEQPSLKTYKITSPDGRTEAIYARITKAEKRTLKMHTIDSGLKLQEVISAAINEYVENHPL